MRFNQHVIISQNTQIVSELLLYCKFSNFSCNTKVFLILRSACGPILFKEGDDDET